MMTSAVPLRLLCVSHYYESHRGGIELVAGQLARRLAAPDLTLTWAACDASPAPTDLSASVLPASNVIERRTGLPFPLLGLRSIARLTEVVRESDVVLVHDSMYPISIAAIVASRLWHRPVILVQHIGRVPANSTTLRTLFWIADRFLARPMLRLASQVIFVSMTSAGHFGNMSMRRKAMLIFNGVDTEVFRPSVSDSERVLEREQIGWPSDRPVMLFVGRFLEKKGLLRLREMSAMRPNLHWAFAGWGPCDPDTWNLRNVTVHRGRSGADLAPLYRAADLFLLPSKSEGFPLVVQEALACGLRPVCCDDAATADPDATAHLTSISNEGSEVDVVRQYLAAVDALTVTPDGPVERCSRAEFARRHYAWEITAERYRSLLRLLISGSKCGDDHIRATG